MKDIIGNYGRTALMFIIAGIGTVFFIGTLLGMFERQGMVRDTKHTRNQEAYALEENVPSFEWKDGKKDFKCRTTDVFLPYDMVRVSDGQDGDLTASMKVFRIQIKEDGTKSKQLLPKEALDITRPGTILLSYEVENSREIKKVERRKLLVYERSSEASQDGE
ncbi:MAG: hypothetical protein ACLSX0_01545 [Anaerostipes caccae]|jgi:hypothetical protein